MPPSALCRAPFRTPGRTRATSISSGSCVRRLWRIWRKLMRSRIHCAQDGRRRMPDIELRIQLAAQPLDVDQGLLQQDELRLDLHVEAARDLEQPHQQGGEGDLLQRPVEYRLAHGAHRRFDLVHARARGHPAGLDVQLSPRGGSRGRRPRGNSRRDSSDRADRGCRRCRSRWPRSAAGPDRRPARRCCRDACRRGRSCGGTPA